MRRAVLMILAAALAWGGTLMAIKPAEAVVPPVWPKCERVQLNSDTLRIWMSPGNLYEVDQVIVGYAWPKDDVEMTRRNDGVWVADIPVPQKRLKNTLYFQFNTDGQGSWTKCNKVMRGGR